MLSLLTLLPLALVNAAAISSSSKFTSSRCQTYYGTQKATASLPTTVSTSYTPCQTVIRTTTTTTRTCAPTTITVTRTGMSTATAPTSTLTATSTITSTQTVTTTTTTTSTSVTAVDSTSTPIYTVSTTSGFIPVRSSLPQPNSYSGSGGSSPVQKRELDIEERDTGLRGYYPQAVTCVAFLPSSTCQTQLVTVTATAVALARTSTVTKSTTVTTTVYPSATTTTTTTSIATATSTVTNTFTTTSTTTNTIAAPTQTYYQACAEINFADTYNGQWINSIYNNGRPYSDFYGSTANSAYECCVNAFLYSQDSEPVGVWNFNPPSNFRVFQNQNCNAYVNRAASAQVNGQGGIIYSQATSQGVVGNGYYGELTMVYTS